MLVYDTEEAVSNTHLPSHTPLFLSIATLLLWCCMLLCVDCWFLCSHVKKCRMNVSQLYILSSRGDKLAFKDYRHDVPANSDEIFFRKFKFWDSKLNQAPYGDCPPFFTEKGIQFCFVRRRSLLFVCTTVANASPNTTVEVLLRVVQVIKDFLGVLTEESIRKNFTLVYELWDEMVDLGIPQEMNPTHLRSYIFHDVVTVRHPDIAPESMLDRLQRFDVNERTKRSDAAAVSIVHNESEPKNEIFVDVLERLNVVFNAAGGVVVADVDAAVVVKSFLAGSPTVYLGLNEDLIVGRRGGGGTTVGATIVDSVCFHDEAVTDRFERERVIVMRPPTGECTLITYRATSGIALPFVLSHSLQRVAAQKVELVLRIRADFPSTVSSTGTRVVVPLPLTTTHAAVEIGVGGAGQSFEYRDDAKEVTWRLPRFTGGTEQVGKVYFTSSVPVTPVTLRAVGPVSLFFEIPQHGVTGLRIVALNVEERGSAYNPDRWIRNITQANSYVFRLH